VYDILKNGFRLSSLASVNNSWKGVIGCRATGNQSRSVFKDLDAFDGKAFC
jgi:hypothetical protein